MSTPVDSSLSNPIRVLAWPATRKEQENPYTYMVQKHTKSQGVTTEEFSFLNLLRFRWDIIHIHWPEMVLTKPGLFFQLASTTALIVLLFSQKLFGSAKIVWTMHNENAHEVRYPRLGRVYMGCFYSLVDGIIYLSDASRRLMSEKNPALSEKPSTVARLGHYKGLYPEPIGTHNARADLGLEDDIPIVLFFGQIRPYKNVCHLIKTFKKIHESDIMMVVAGKPADQSMADQVIEAAADDNRIKLDLDFIENEELSRYLSAADLVVLPFKNVLNSASVLLSLSQNRPVLVPSTDSFEEIKGHVGPGWITTYQGRLTADLLLTCTSAPSRAGTPDLSEYEWPRIGETTANFFKSLLS